MIQPCITEETAQNMSKGTNSPSSVPLVNYSQRLLSQVFLNSETCYNQKTPPVYDMNDTRRFIPGSDGKIFYKGEDGLLTVLVFNN
jgi:hypothetical protein